MSGRFAKLEGKLKFGFVRRNFLLLLIYVTFYFTSESLFEQMYLKIRKF